MAMITLKEVFLKESKALGALDKQISKVSSASEAQKFTEEYAKFIELVDGLAGSSLDGPHEPEEKAYREDPNNDQFFKFLLSHTKRELFAGSLDWDHLPNERTLAKKVFAALKNNRSNSAHSARAWPKRTSRPNPEDHAARMHRGDYGKLDQ